MTQSSETLDQLVREIATVCKKYHDVSSYDALDAINAIFEIFDADNPDSWRAYLDAESEAQS